jgi:hypothetical protein
MKRFPSTLLFLAWAGLAPLRADFHVAPTGSDAHSGSERKPFATLEKARDAVRDLKSAGKVPKAGLTVWLHGPEYVRTQALDLSEADSGTASAPIVWRSAAGSPVRLLGGRRLTGFQPVTDPAVLRRFDEAARGKVLELDLRKLGVTGFGGMSSRGFGRPVTAAHPELFFAGRPMPLARWPNGDSWEKIAGFPDGSGKNDDHGGNIGDLPGGFFYAGDRPRRWKDTADLWVHGYWAWDWANSYEHVVELDRDRRFLRTAAPHGLYGFRKGQRFQFLNVLEELDQPGEWYLDRNSGHLYFWPPSPVAGSDAVLSLLEQPLLRLNGASHVVVKGLVLEATRGNGVEIRHGSDCRIEDCVIRNIGDWGVTVDGGFRHGVVGCDVFDTGDGGVTLTGGDRQTLTPAGHFVENTHFQRQARWSRCYAPAIALTGVGMRASHNLIHDHPHAGILYWGNDHLMEFNEIHHIALETGDVGAIYTGRDYSFRGNRIRNNYIHETGGVGMGSMGVYMDDCVSGTEVTGNVFYRVHWAMFIGGGRDHRVENNLFVECDPAVRADGRGLDKSPVWRDMVDKTMRDSLNAVPAALYRERYPAMKSLDAAYGPPGGPALTGDAFRGVPPSGNVIERNVCRGPWLEAGWQASESDLKVSDNYVTADPKQVGGPAEAFRIPKESPAWKTGFQAIPFSQIGLRKGRIPTR